MESKTESVADICICCAKMFLSLSLQQLTKRAIMSFCLFNALSCHACCLYVALVLFLFYCICLLCVLIYRFLCPVDVRSCVCVPSVFVRSCGSVVYGCACVCCGLQLAHRAPRPSVHDNRPRVSAMRPYAKPPGG